MRLLARYGEQSQTQVPQLSPTHPQFPGQNSTASQAFPQSPGLSRENSRFAAGRNEFSANGNGEIVEAVSGDAGGSVKRARNERVHNDEMLTHSGPGAMLLGRFVNLLAGDEDPGRQDESFSALSEQLENEKRARSQLEEQLKALQNQLTQRDPFFASDASNAKEKDEKPEESSEAVEKSGEMVSQEIHMTSLEKPRSANLRKRAVGSAVEPDSDEKDPADWKKSS
eukprot:CAMPEP_0182442882 /NCGR_PEP_ID=MMETSP1172-20130603/1741_1 /TAXON_ID=708627 /ORGANISM="Timspurckia oligopyrenoides, Strain CCMP3278" /LENGTH=225 /DNA_ID=CAMNT_0024637951 /DNA_START=397 /DNA_END=1074 /DNA_ORIENTATION=-